MIPQIIHRFPYNIQRWDTIILPEFGERVYRKSRFLMQL